MQILSSVCFCPNTGSLLEQKKQPVDQDWLISIFLTQSPARAKEFSQLAHIDFLTWNCHFYFL